jgi:hypothetical protein
MNFITKEDFVFDGFHCPKWVAKTEKVTITIYISVGWHSSIDSEYVLHLSVNGKTPIILSKKLGEYYDEDVQKQQQDKDALLQWGLETINDIQTLPFHLLSVKL